MCGRLDFGSSAEVAAKLGVEDSDGLRDGDPNLPPYSKAVVFGILDRNPNKLMHMGWPLVPSWSKEYPKFNTSNAKSEEMHEKTAYKGLLGKRHCIVAVNGFYEWERKGENRSFYFTMADGSQMMFAGLWDYNKILIPPVLSCTIITREPNEIIGEVHDRMPVILTKEQMKIWLDTTLPYEERAKVLQPIENSYILKREVGKSVGKATNKSRDWFNDKPDDCLF
ncbi:SOS response-associated peptidase [Mucilaginibacter flavidus]|uniref:SOS response-associated peptidase n=1 Tax=Mucilaginibacter flavidus TaxID=2949309 RepID=UPI00209285EF|nr:SOS response-associated peptidase [Mucilaginibacter flavidus]MCO5948074.1 SOS response-associated peptidase [Mucilaginibacter flavidus]